LTIIAAAFLGVGGPLAQECVDCILAHLVKNPNLPPNAVEVEADYVINVAARI